ncbi:hypothetical protein GCM10009827_084020 [Dactylosporangium maewongense]|uniref:RNA polymerase sigma factor 70 region 4 type 2 domain-containing protein n=1 Tax=Dactylosporangium maewongense TaxID=634393 RepID=A0ABN2C0G9_9ACTN
MTITLDRPASPAPTEAASTASCPQGLSWCTGEPGNHDLETLREDETIYHDSPWTDLPMSGGDDRGSDGFTISIERQDALDGTPGRTRIYLATTRGGTLDGQGGGYATLDEADRIAREIAEHVTTVRGMKRASAVRVGDLVSIDRTAHVVAGVMLDAESGALNIFTRQSGAEPAAQFKASEMVPLRGQERQQNTEHLGPAAVAALCRLSACQRIAMHLRYVDGRTLGDTARIMGVSSDKVKTYVRRAKAQLREWGALDAAPAFGGAV